MSWDHPSKWLDWLKSLDWSHLDNVLSSIVGATVIAGIVWAAIKFLWNPLFERLGRRRAQSKLLDRLACSSSVDYIESMFGAAQFITYEDKREQRTYHLPGAWVMVEVKDARVIAFSITMMDAYFRDLLNRGDYSRHYSEDVELELRGTDQRYRGREAAKNWVEGIHAFGDIKVRNTFIGEAHAVAEAEFVRKDGISVPYSVIYDVAAGKITALRLYFTGPIQP